jgi:hypothetical protein
MHGTTTINHSRRRNARVEVEAVDVRGSRQLEPEAGLIGVRR